MENEGRQLAAMTYIWAGEHRMVIDHTEVDASLKGQGIGKQLLDAVVQEARSKGLTILPLCPFAKAAMAKEPGYGDVLMG